MDDKDLGLSVGKPNGWLEGLFSRRQLEISAVLCNTVVHNHIHNDMSNTYRLTVLGLGV